MSTGADCRFIETEPGQWVYELQQYPYGASEDYDRYGPFSSFATAHNHLHDNHANPGGYSTRTLPDGQHVHEWHVGSAMVPVGFIVEVRVESLGPDADRDAVMALVQSLDPNHPAINVRVTHGLRDDVTSCRSCNRTPEEVTT